MLRTAKRLGAALGCMGTMALALSACAPALGARGAAGADDEARAPRDTTRSLPTAAPTYDSAAAPRRRALEGDDAMLDASLRAALGDRGRGLAEDARLDALAAWVECDPVATGAALPSATVIDAAARRLGLVDPLPYVVCVQAPRSAEALRGQLLSVLAAIPSNIALSHSGVATRSVAGGLVGVVAVSAREVRVAPFPRQVAFGNGTPSLTVEGEAAARFTSTRLSVTTPSGTTVEREGASHFAYPVVTPTAGVYEVEVLGDGPSGPVVILNVKVFAGVVEPSTVTIEAPPAPSAPGDGTPANAEARLLELVAKARVSASVGPVKLDDELSRLALAHAKDMSAHGFMGHVSPTYGDFATRARVAGIDAMQLGENVAFADSPEAIHQSLMGSPAHRANLLDAGMNAVGIAVVSTQDGSGATRLYAVEVFARRVPPLDPTTAPDAIVAEANKARATHNQKPLVRDPKLDALVRDAVAAAASKDQVEPAALAEAHRLFSARMRGVHGCLFVNRAREVAQVVSGSWATGDEATRVGIAVGPIAGSPEGLVAIVTTGTKALKCE